MLKGNQFQKMKKNGFKECNKILLIRWILSEAHTYFTNSMKSNEMVYTMKTLKSYSMKSKYFIFYEILKHYSKETKDIFIL